MGNLIVSSVARQDLKKIWRYSRKNWGVAAAHDYIRKLNAEMYLLAERPDRGRACDDIRHGYIKAVCGSHMIFYRLSGDGINVARILHQTMDFQRHL